ncbi:MAG: cytoplasmic protein [Desulfobacterales bacterium]
MAKHSHRFVETFDGFVGFGLNRESDENTLVYYLQKIADDTLARTLVQRMTDSERQAFFDMLGHLLKKHLREDEYHRLFLKD